MNELYQAQILDRSKEPRYRGVLDNPTHRAEGANLSCGDEISWEALVSDGKLTQLKHHGRACAICTASADLLAEIFEGKQLSEIQTYTTEQVQEMIGIPLSPIRLKCALLPLEALKNLEQA
jgi:nitrogen fixation NifU-like protein